MKRRTFLKTTLAVGTTLSLGGSRVLGANDDVRIATIGIGSFVKIGGKGRGDVRDFRKIAGVRVGSILRCEGGHVSRDTAYDNDGRPIEKFTRTRVSTKQNFIDAVRTRRRDQLTSESLEGHLSCGLVHMANISYRIGRQATPDAIRQSIGGEKELAESFARLEEHLAANRIDLAKESLVLGPVLTMDPRTEQFVGTFSKEANALISRAYREPFVVGPHV